MSDAMMGGKGPDLSGNIMGSDNPIKQNMSMFNPVDAAAMKQSGQMNIDPNATAGEAVMQMLSKMGIDPNGPAQQLVEFGRKQVENGDMLGKMKNISGGMEGQPAPRPQQPAPTPGLEGLLNAGRQV